MSLKGSGMWTLGPQLVVLFGEVMGPLGGVFPRWRKYVAGGGLWAVVSVHFLFTLSSCAWSWRCVLSAFCSGCPSQSVSCYCGPALEPQAQIRSLVHPFIWSWRLITATESALLSLAYDQCDFPLNLPANDVVLFFMWLSNNRVQFPDCLYPSPCNGHLKGFYSLVLVQSATVKHAYVGISLYWLLQIFTREWCVVGSCDSSFLVPWVALIHSGWISPYLPKVCEDSPVRQLSFVQGHFSMYQLCHAPSAGQLGYPCSRKPAVEVSDPQCMCCFRSSLVAGVSLLLEPA